MGQNRADYETDFFAWTEEQARLLRGGELSAIDAANIAEEIESLGRSDRRELRSRLTVLLMHLPKWHHQPDARSSGWLGTIREQRRQIDLVLEDSPSLRPFATAALARAYGEAREAAAEETGLPETGLLVECPFTSDEVMSRSFLPD